MGTHRVMVTIRMAEPWQDPRTGILYFRKRIPARFKAVSGRSGDTIKISLGTADRKRIAKPWAEALTRWADMEAEWERALNVVPVTASKAQEMAARWGAWIAQDWSRLDTAGVEHSAFETDPKKLSVSRLLMSPAQRRATSSDEAGKRAFGRLMVHADEAASLARITVAESSRLALLEALCPVVQAAYRQAALRASGITQGEGARWEPLGHTLAAMPPVPDMPARKPATPAVSLDDLFDGWKATSTLKARTLADTRYALNSAIEFLGHRDASQVTRDDLAKWRDTLKAQGLSNTTWNNRLSLVRQVFEWGRKERRLRENVADEDLRLKKSRTLARLPYEDHEVVQILTAARRENRASLRWAPWIMAFSGMRVGEVLQLSASDVRQENGIWFFAVHEDDEGKSVKTGQRRNVPIHSAVIAEGLLDYRNSVPLDGPLFPDKGLDVHGNRGGRAWNVTGKWVRDRVGLRDPRKPPNHAFRHRMEDEMRAAEVPEDARDAIMGHARKTTGTVYGVRGEALSRLSRYLERVKMLDDLARPRCPK